MGVEGAVALKEGNRQAGWDGRCLGRDEVGR